MTAPVVGDVPPWSNQAEHLAWLRRESFRLLDFGTGGVLPVGGFGWIGSDGRAIWTAPAPLYVQARMAHCYALGTMIGHPDAADLCAQALTGIALNQHPAGGWASNYAEGDLFRDGYAHTFVLLAGATLTSAGMEAGPELLDSALESIERFFWDEELGVLRNEARSPDSEPARYVGANANMHYVEALLAAGAATGESAHWDRAERISQVFLDRARGNDMRLPEHFDGDLAPLLDFNAESPHDPLKPYGSTIGHWFEWSRLVLQLARTTGRSATTREELLTVSEQLFDRAVTEGFEPGTAPGFVYTVDWSGRPVVRQRLHWVLCEALQAAVTWWHATEEPHYERLYNDWWALADTWFIDRQHGSWLHELDGRNRPDGQIRRGKSDLYHALQATLAPYGGVFPAIAENARS
ncbi:AGE family epimerase/isomerase [Pseudactinotalea suaedae]|uniref:AGE family epimerase/isomerase n=1 Tax=Pseudactinotalea suaedae TaxID=1524924 RepID=UPI001390DA58|nr:AGE family epimerase/isomerase [Pseudactinotalea suaedae]